jgi:hypothetical protein
MMRVESGWTQKMNKEQYGKTTGNKAKNKPLYMNGPSYKKRQDKLQTDRFIWRIGFAIITVVLALGIWAIWSVATL